MKTKWAEAPSLWAALESESQQYGWQADPSVQPRWDIPEKIAINGAVAGRSGVGLPEYPVDIEEYIDAASEIIEAGACGVHIDYTWVTDSKGRRLDLDLPPIEAYGLTVGPLRERFGNDFVANLNILNGKTFAECVAPIDAGLGEVAPCAAGHPVDFVQAAVGAITEIGASPEIVVHSSGEVELAKQRLFDSGILSGRKTNWIILFALPVTLGRTLISGAWANDTRSLTTHLCLMVDQIRTLDPDAAITVCNGGRAGLYVTTLATMLGLNIRVGLEDGLWKYPNRDDINKSNLELFTRARDVADTLGRVPASANEYRRQIGIAEK